MLKSVKGIGGAMRCLKAVSLLLQFSGIDLPEVISKGMSGRGLYRTPRKIGTFFTFAMVCKHMGM